LSYSFLAKLNILLFYRRIFSTFCHCSWTSCKDNVLPFVAWEQASRNINFLEAQQKTLFRILMKHFKCIFWVLGCEREEESFRQTAFSKPMRSAFRQKNCTMSFFECEFSYSFKALFCCLKAPPPSSGKNN
jgi:hypothetical protein